MTISKQKTTNLSLLQIKQTCRKKTKKYLKIYNDTLFYNIL